MNRIIKAIGVLAALAFTVPAQADFTYTLNVEIGGDDEGTSALILFTNFIVNGTDVEFDVVAANTTPSPNPGGAMTSLAWLMPTEAISLTLDSQTAINDGNGIDFNLIFNAAFNPLGNTMDVCLETKDNNNCTGGSVKDGLAAGGTATFMLTAGFDSAIDATNFETLLAAAINAGVSTGGMNPITAAGICARFQGLGEGIGGYTGEGSDKKCGGDGGGGGNGKVPEPGTLALLGIGLVGLGLTRRRRALK